MFSLLDVVLNILCSMWSAERFFYSREREMNPQGEVRQSGKPQDVSVFSFQREEDQHIDQRQSCGSGLSESYEEKIPSNDKFSFINVLLS